MEAETNRPKRKQKGQTTKGKIRKTFKVQMFCGDMGSYTTKSETAAAAPEAPRKSRMTLELEQAYAEGKAARLRDHDGAATSVNVVNPYTNAAFAFAWNQGYSDQDTEIGKTAPAAPRAPRNLNAMEDCAGSEEQSLANARLIAAAPELLAALKDIHADCNDALGIRTAAGLDFAVQQSADRARAAIAAAEGSNQ